MNFDFFIRKTSLQRGGEGPVAMTLFLLGWYLAFSLILNDSVKVLLFRGLDLGRQGSETRSESKDI